MGKRRNTTRKALRMESLEARQLMAADIGLHHGILNVRGTHQDDVIKMDQVQVARASKAYQGTSIIKVSVANKQGKVLKAAQFDARAVKKIKAYGYNGHDRITNNTRIPSDLQGGSGNDMLQGGAAVDQVFGSYGNDTLRGGAGHDKLYGGSGHDRIYGNSGNDYLSGDPGNDRIYAGSGNDVAHGGSGNDMIRGASGHDHLYAGVGRDQLYGDQGSDVLHQGSRSDRAIGGQGQDRIMRDRKATSTAAARKVHEASIADSKVEAVKGPKRVESSLGQAKKQVVRRHFPQTYRQHGVTLDQLKKLRSVKPIHAENNASENNALGARQLLKIEEMRQVLGLTDVQASEVAEKAEARSRFIRVLTSEDEAIELDASAASLGVNVEDAKKAGLKNARDLWEIEGGLKSVGSPEGTTDIIDAANEAGGGDDSTKKPLGKAVGNALGLKDFKGSPQDALREAKRRQSQAASPNSNGSNDTSGSTSPSSSSSDDQFNMNKGSKGSAGSSKQPVVGNGSDKGTDSDSNKSPEVGTNGNTNENKNEEESHTGRSVTITNKESNSSDQNASTVFDWEGTDESGNKIEGSTFYTQNEDGTWSMNVIWGEDGSYSEDNSDAPPSVDVGDSTTLIDGDPDKDQEAHFAGGSKEEESSDGDSKEDDNQEDDEEKEEEGNEEDDDEEDDDEEDDEEEDDEEEDDEEEDEEEDDDDEKDDDEKDDGDDTPNPQDEESGGTERFVFGRGSFLGNQERARKWNEIVSNMSGYGLWDPNPADESESGGGVHNPKNHDDGGYRVKEKAESAGSAKDIEVSAGGGVTDPPFDKDRVKLKAKSWKK